MKNDDLNISGFNNDAYTETSFSIDFNDAKQLKSNGSTCDVYECTVQHRHVFVKKLKSEFRNNPLYRAAFNKEYDLGVSLRHPSLPCYIGFGDDYIVMDFIEGDTLADLIKQNDKRLDDKQFIKKLIGELIDVVEYLHYSHIIHCDIKADNIIISPYRDRPVTLIDFDKAYSPWFDSTHGNPAIYDCNNCADGQIDFKGIGSIAKLLGQNRIAQLCCSDAVTADKVRKVLKPLTHRVWMWAIAATAVTCLVIAVFALFFETPAPNSPTPSDPTVTVTPIPPVDTAVNHEPYNHSPEITEEISDKTLPDVDDIVKNCYAKLTGRQEYLRALATDSTTSAYQLKLAITSYQSDRDNAQDEIVLKVISRYGLTNPLEAHSMLGTSSEWSRFMKQDSEICQLYCNEIEKRELATANPDVR